MATASDIDPGIMIGTFRRFGAYGPVYQVISLDGTMPDGDVAVPVRIIESGEEAHCRLAHLPDDPRVH